MITRSSSWNAGHAIDLAVVDHDLRDDAVRRRQNEVRTRIVSGEIKPPNRVGLQASNAVFSGAVWAFGPDKDVDRHVRA